MAEKWQKAWLSDEQGARYGRVLYRRAVGDLPEMESSKAAARHLRALVRPGDTILDVGCAAGHYLRSLQRGLDVPFTYTGADITDHYLDLARKAFAGAAGVEFRKADIYDLPFGDAAYDVVMSNNVLIHLPSIEKPVAELCRVARRHVLIRAMVSDRSFKIMDVNKAEDGGEFDADGEPVSFQYFNIYSRDYFGYLLSKQPRVNGFTFVDDTDFDPAAIAESAGNFDERASTTGIVAGMQARGCVLAPWAFILVDLT